MDQAEADQFLASGRSMVTAFAQSTEILANWSAAFDVRGGEPVYGQDVLQIVTLSNMIQEFLTPEKMAIINTYRTDV